MMTLQASLQRATNGTLKPWPSSIKHRNGASTWTSTDACLIRDSASMSKYPIKTNIAAFTMSKALLDTESEVVEVPIRRFPVGHGHQCFVLLMYGWAVEGCGGAASLLVLQAFDSVLLKRSKLIYSIGLGRDVRMEQIHKTA